MATPHVAGAAALYLQRQPRRHARAGARRARRRRHDRPRDRRRAPARRTCCCTRPPLSGGDHDRRPRRPRRAAWSNGGFESGATGWSQSDPAIISTHRPGAQRQLVGLARRLQRRQRAGRPDGDGPERRRDAAWAWQLGSSEPAGTRAYDLLHVRVHSTSGALLGTLVSRSNTSARDAWVAESASLGPWAGQTVSVRFVATNDSSYAVELLRGRRQPGLSRPGGGRCARRRARASAGGAADGPGAHGVRTAEDHDRGRLEPVERAPRGGRHAARLDEQHRCGVAARRPARRSARPTARDRSRGRRPASAPARPARRAGRPWRSGRRRPRGSPYHRGRRR